MSSFGRGGSTSSTSAGTYKYANIPNNPENITGGYLLEFDLPERYAAEATGFVTNRSQSVVIKSPEYASKAQVQYIRSYVQDMEDAIYSSSGYNSKGKYYTDYIDLEAAAKMYLVQEVFKNNDAVSTSFYLCKDKDGKTKFTPAWDFEWALGGYNNSKLTNPEGWNVNTKKIYGKTELCLLAALSKKEDFMNEVAKYWHSGFSDGIKVLIGKKSSEGCNYIKSIDEYASEIKASASMNFKKYNVLGDVSWGSANTGSTFTKNINYVKNFLSKRVEFMDNNLKYEPKELTLSSINFSKNSPQSIGKNITISADVKGGTGEYNYEFKINDEVVSTGEKSYSWTPTEIGDYKISVSVTDSTGAKVSKEASYRIKEVSQNFTTIYYKKSSFSNVNIHYKVGTGTWTTLPGVKMEKSDVYDGFFETTIDLGDEESITACFNNGNNTWDNNGTKNYTLGSGSYKIENGVVTKLEDIKFELKNFYSDSSDNLTTGNSIKLIADTVGGTGNTVYKFYLEDGTIIDEGSNNYAEWTPTEEGEYKIFVQAKDGRNNIVESSLTLRINKAIEIKEFKSNCNGKVKVGTAIKFDALAEGGTGTLSYKFILDNDVVIQNSTDNSFEWIPLILGNHTITVEVFDEKNISSKKDITINIYDELKSVQLKCDKETCKLGDNVNISADVIGGNDPINYKFIINDIVLNEGNESTISWKPEEVGEYEITVIATDSDGNVVTDNVAYTVNEKKSNIVKVYYKGYTNPNIYYKLGTGSWTASPGVPMTKSIAMDGYYEITIDLGEEDNMTACFNDGNGNWDNNSKNNYKFKAGVYSVYNKVVTDLTDRPLEVSSFSADPKESQTIEKSVVLSATALYGKEDYSYKFTLIFNGEERVLKDYSSDNTYLWDPESIGDYTLKVYIKDANGDVVEEEMPYIVKEVSKNVVTIYYNKYSNPYIHYKIGNGSWTTVPGVQMEESVDMPGFYEITIDLGEEETLTACFNNGSGSWDNNSSKNYTFTKGKYKLVNGEIIIL